MTYEIRFAPAPVGDSLPWKLKLDGVLLGAFTSEADAEMFKLAIEQSRQALKEEMDALHKSGYFG